MNNKNSLPRIQQYREAYKPFCYPEYFDYFKKAVATVWRAETVDMNSDVKDFLTNSTDDERWIIQGILRGFTILETHIGDHWSDRVTKIFPKHEIAAACRAFAFFEAIHAQAYSHLSDSLGLNEYDAFLSDDVTRQKIDYFIEHPNDLVSLAVFSGAGEGVSLFSSFAALLSLSRDGRFKGLAQIISWSAIDENSHSDMGCKLFKQLADEKGITTEEKQLILEGFDTVLDNEFSFINQIFEGRSLSYITADELKDYMRFRANERLGKLGFNPRYKVEGLATDVIEWFHTEVMGQSSNDFFYQSLDGGNYTSLISQNFDSIDYNSISMEWSD